MSEKKTIRILAVDNEEDILYMYKDIIKELEDEKVQKNLNIQDYVFDVKTCKDGIEAVNAITEAADNDKPYDICFIDIKMQPGPDGIWVGRKIAEYSPNSNIVIVTGYPEFSPSGISDNIDSAQKVRYIEKPFKNSEITSLIVSIAKA